MLGQRATAREGIVKRTIAIMRIVFSLLFFVTTAHADPTWIHAELDPLTFANSGYGGQVGFRVPQLHGVRLAVASFSLHVPDPISQLHGNGGFDEKVEPSGAFYALYCFGAAGEDGFSVGASFRILKLSITRDDTADAEARVTEISPEAIVGYQWHPFPVSTPGFYLQPWLGLGVDVWKNHEAIVGGKQYSELPIDHFFTVNIGYEQPL